MPKLPVFKGKEFIKFLEYLGYQVTRTKGSHSRLKSEEGRGKVDVFEDFFLIGFLCPKL